MAKKASSGRKASARRGVSAAKSSAQGAKKAARKASKKAPKKAAPKQAASTVATAEKAPTKKARRSPKKSPMKKAELKQYRQLLYDKRRELVCDMTGIEAEAFGTDRQESKGDISDHPADAGTDNFEQEFSLGLLESERTLLAEIDEALGRIEEGTFGVCMGTGQPISKARLKARPWAKYSIEYARMVEKGLVRPGERLYDDEDDE